MGALLVFWILKWRRREESIYYGTKWTTRTFRSELDAALEKRKLLKDPYVRDLTMEKVEYGRRIFKDTTK